MTNEPVWLNDNDIYKMGVTDERNRIIKLISQMPELGAGVNANHMVEQVALRDRIIEEITK